VGAGGTAVVEEVEVVAMSIVLGRAENVRVVAVVELEEHAGSVVTTSARPARVVLIRSLRRAPRSRGITGTDAHRCRRLAAGFRPNPPPSAVTNRPRADPGSATQQSQRHSTGEDAYSPGRAIANTRHFSAELIATRRPERRVVRPVGSGGHRPCRRRPEGAAVAICGDRCQRLVEVGERSLALESGEPDLLGSQLGSEGFFRARRPSRTATGP
jgi:hypothetical protein